jgi:hypothetical protein
MNKKKQALQHRYCSGPHFALCYKTTCCVICASVLRNRLAKKREQRRDQSSSFSAAEIEDSVNEEEIITEDIQRTEEVLYVNHPTV